MFFLSFKKRNLNFLSHLVFSKRKRNFYWPKKKTLYTSFWFPEWISNCFEFGFCSLREFMIRIPESSNFRENTLITTLFPQKFYTKYLLRSILTKKWTPVTKHGVLFFSAEKKVSINFFSLAVFHSYQVFFVPHTQSFEK